MPVISLERAIELGQSETAKGAAFRSHLHAALGIMQEGAGYDPFGVPLPRPRLNRESVVQLYDQLRTYIGQHGFFRGKYLRPWEHDPNLLGKLDRSQPWWGWEFEMGFADTEARREAVHYAWDNFTGVTFDREGEGAAPVEITFLATEKSNYDKGIAPAQQFMKWIEEEGRTYNGGATAIGTHINFSLPDTTENQYHAIAEALNRSLAVLDESKKQRLEMFGRSQLYGGFNSGNVQWIEGKLYRTTYSTEGFARYCRSAGAITRAAMALRDKNVNKKWCVTNLYEMYQNEEALPNIVEVKVGFQNNSNGNAECEHIWDINTGYTCVYYPNASYGERSNDWREAVVGGKETLAQAA